MSDEYGRPSTSLGKRQEGNALLAEADRMRDRAIALLVAAAHQYAIEQQRGWTDDLRA